MSKLEDEQITEEVGLKQETARSPWVGSDFQHDMLTQQTLISKEITTRDQVIAAHNDRLMMLDKKLDELLHVGQHLTDGFENIRKLIEKQGHENAELPSVTNKYLEVFLLRLSEVIEQQGHKVEKLINMKKELAEDFLNLSTLGEQHSYQPVERSNIVGGKDAIDSPSEKEGIETHESAKVVYDESSDIAALKLSIDSVVARLKQDNEKTINRYQTKLKALKEAFVKKTEDLVQFHEKIESQKLEISNLTLHIENSKAKDEEIDNLKLLVKLANKKLEERREQMERIGKVTCILEQQLTQLITDVKVNETRQPEDVQPHVASVPTVMSSLTEIRDHIKHVTDNWKTNEDTIVMKTDLTPSDNLTRLQLLYKPITERLSAKVVAVELFQNDALSLAELQKIQCSQTEVDAAEYLLNRLLEVHSDASYCCFLNALKATNQEDVFLWLTGGDGSGNLESHKIDDEHANLIRRKCNFLLNYLNLQESGLIALLCEKNVIDQREKDFLESDGGAACQIEKLLSVLSRRSTGQLELFLVALDQIGQRPIADELLACPPSVEPAEASVIASVERQKAAAGSAKAGKDSRTNVTTDVKFKRTNKPSAKTTHNLMLKYVILGGNCTGKTSFVHRFVKNEHLHNPFATIGANFTNKLINVNAKVVKLELWDTAGQERFGSSSMKMYIRGAAGAFLVYDIRSRDTFDHLAGLMSALRKFADPSVVVTLIGNRKDLDAQREVTFLEGSTFAQKNDMLFLETSAWSGENVEEAFLQCTRVILAKMESARKQIVSSSITDRITHTITASDDRKGAVEGLTAHGNELFIVRYEQHKLQSQTIIDVYDASNLTFKRNIQIEELQGRARGLTSCDANNCL